MRNAFGRLGLGLGFNTPSFTPLALPNLRLWLRGDVGSTSAWTDQSLQANTPTGIGPPSTTTLAGMPAFSFAGGMQFKKIGTSIFATPGSARTIILVTKDAVAGASGILSERITDNTCQYHAHYQFSGNTIVCGDEQNGAQNIIISGQPDFTKANWSIITMTGAGNAPTYKYKLIGDSSPTDATMVSGVQGTESGAAGFAVGAVASDANYSGAIAEAICCESAIAGTNLTKLIAYLGARYGI